ncbi:MAG: alanine--tRNA ligase [Candidatus Thermoplasmatota archaeon]|jgi:alanyl-tRNA synthetase|nr:alanine--tRNA ligase [Candidatus Thermoplasmatota archaeon]MDP7266203.1 alanine--tRNA ligase [Candidatus Thermoplasmatota archaeon]
MLEGELELDYFKNNGYIKKICPKCRAPFWTMDPNTELCGDSPCNGYSFLFTPMIKDPLTMNSMRRKFLDFFAKNGHAEIDPYPVVARWRDDIYLTIASIADFQPHVTSGAVKPPANPLAISQPCIRLNDLDNVGRSGRHLSEFEMMGHHVFNNPTEEIYWKEETVKYCNELMVDDLGIPAKAITYREDPWFGGGNAGPALEVLVGGLELATLVFMNMIKHPKGDIEIGGDKYRNMDTYIVDTGYGLERFVWMSSGAPTLYEAIYPELIREIFDAQGIEHDLDDDQYRAMIGGHVNLCGQIDISTPAHLMEMRKRLSKDLRAKGYDISLEKIMEKMMPLEKSYIIADHTRALAFMLGDGIVPSNIKAGYLARLLLRRCFRYIEEMEGTVELDWVIDRHLDLLDTFPHLKENRDLILDIVSREAKRYRKTLAKGKGMVERMLTGKKGDKNIPLEKLIDLYDTHGIHPSVVQKVMEEQGEDFTVPDGFSTLLALRHGQSKSEDEVMEITADYPPTDKVFYGDEYLRKISAKLIAVDEHGLVFDRTVFYPEGGGQPGDTGIIIYRGGRIQIIDTIKAEGVVFHVVDTDSGTLPEPGDEVEMEIDWERRIALMRHHTATHVILGAARAVLGNHIWQQGAQKFPDRARFDISHYKRITPEELDEIERVANISILEGKKVKKKWYTLDEAMDIFGSSLFQGGAPKGNDIRVVEIEKWDREACAGTHVDNTSEIGMIKIMRNERLQDGVERLEYAAGMAAVNYIQSRENIIRRACEPVHVPPKKLPDTVERFFNEWKAQQKEIERLRKENARNLVSGLLSKAEPVGNVKFVYHRSDSDMKELQTIAGELTMQGKTVALLVSDLGGVKMLLCRSGDVDMDMVPVLREGMKAVKGGGGGRPDFAQGGGRDPSGIPRAREIIFNKIKESF